MDYEKKYKEALEWIRKIYPTMTGCDKEDAEHHFPELVESEDEQIRKHLIKHFQNKTKKEWNGMPIKDILTWLERHDKQKLANPKFKVGDWITNGNYTWKIVKVRPFDYILQSQDGNEGFPYIDCVDRLFRLWTIQDAKDGDVLSFNDGHGNDCIELIKSITGKKIEFWFCLTNGNRYEVFDGITPYTNLASRKDATPATKEQRDTLMEAMADAGYEWDVEKKELKKIEQKPEHAYCQEHCQGYKESGGKCYFGFDCKAKRDAKKTSAWSEEDEIFLNRAIKVIKQNHPMTANWLKSLKDRVLPQNTWKPSDEQMEALGSAIHCYAGISPTNNREVYALEIMKEQLKKLKEE